MHWAYPENKLFLILIPLLIGIFILYIFLRKKDLKAIGEFNILKKLSSNVNTVWHNIKFLFFLTAFAFAIIALMGPKWDKERINIREGGAEILFILDNSLSMLAEDVYDGSISYNTRNINRFDMSKKVMDKIITYLDGNKMSLILAAKDAQIECPLTFNSELIKNAYLKNARIAPKNRQGTQLSNAIESGLSLFSEGRLFPKFIILFSDGEDHQSPLEAVVKKAKKLNIVIFTIGVGSKQGGIIPLNTLEFGPLSYKEDSQQKKVITQLQERTLKYIAKVTNGEYFHLKLNQNLGLLYENLYPMKQSNFRDRHLLVLKDQFQIFILISIFFICLALFLPENKVKLKKLFGGKKIPVFLLIFIVTTAFKQDLDTGNEYYTHKKYDKAIKEYSNAIKEQPQSPEAYLKRGNSFYKKKKYKKALNDYRKGAKFANKSQLKSDFRYNMGNSLRKMGIKANNNRKLLTEALENFKISLKHDPNNLNAKNNYFILKDYLDKLARPNKSSIKNKNSQQKQKSNPDTDQSKENPSMQDKKGNLESPQKMLNEPGPAIPDPPQIKRENRFEDQEMKDKLDELLRRDQENRGQLGSLNGQQGRSKYNEKDW